METRRETIPRARGFISMSIRCFVAVGLLLGGALLAASAADPRPNVILVLADDLGAKELGCYGNPKHKTPHLDAMAAAGTRLETFYANPLCTPTRMALMTGQYGFHNGFLGMSHPGFIPLPGSPQRDIANHYTHAALMRSAGYATALSGKWQLSGKLPELVYEAGFDEYRMWAYDKNLPDGVRHPAHEDGGNACRYWHPSILQNGKYLPTRPEDYGPDLFNEFVIDFARRHKEHPFFIYYTSVLTHSPHLETPDPKTPGARRPATFQSNLEYLDHLMGRLFSALREEELERNTVVIFIGDNGTGGSGKATLTELGARTPCIVRGPGVQAGRVSPALGDLTDIFPTLADISGAAMPDDRPFDGHSLLPVLRGEKAAHRDWIYSHLDDGRVLRDSRWLLEINKEGKGEKFFDCGECRDGSTYRDVTGSDDPEVRAARARFAVILAGLPQPKAHAVVTNPSHSRGKSAGPALPRTAEREARFKQRDRDQDGRIVLEEFLASMRGGAKEGGKARFQKMDSNGDGALTFEEFLQSKE